MKNFRIGQDVVYIKRSIPESGLVKNKIYIIEGLAMCGCSQNVDVGVRHNSTSCQCPTCCETICYDQRWFIHEEAFEPVISSEQLASMVSESMPVCAMCGDTGVIGNGPTSFNPQVCPCKVLQRK